jgi:DNA-directed RNA polymerase subunit RPC12/RpoP
MARRVGDTLTVPVTAGRSRTVLSDETLHGVAALTCPYCGCPDIQPMPNKEPRTKVVVTPYHCTVCQHTFESGPFQLPQKAHQSDPKP